MYLEGKQSKKEYSVIQTPEVGRSVAPYCFIYLHENIVHIVILLKDSSYGVNRTKKAR